MTILPVILSGGSGSRLWPASTEAQPKQFHALSSAHTLLQQTVRRTAPPEFLDPLVICNHRHGALVREQLEGIGVVPAAVILEPFARSTAAAAIVAAAWAARWQPGALVLLTPADQIIVDEDGFGSAVQAASDMAAEHIITFGMTPTGPETGFGYIRSGPPIGPGIFKIDRFVEKPKREVAEGYLAAGGYYWNAGAFLYNPAVLLCEAEALCPDILNAALAALDGARTIDTGLLLEPGTFETCPSIALDIAIMEKTRKGAVMPLDIGWADIGSWSELWRHGQKDPDDNHVRGDAVLIEASGSMIWAAGPSVSVIGLSDIIVVATADHVLVATKARAQDVKLIVEARKARDQR